ncbi:MAG TPA: hypothetical protein ENI23_16325 [bacterium]|nr:hypothetical protein [bacterium]
MKINEQTKCAKTGIQMAEAIITILHLYLNDNALEILNTLIKTLQLEFQKRITIRHRTQFKP